MGVCQGLEVILLITFGLARERQPASSKSLKINDLPLHTTLHLRSARVTDPMIRRHFYLVVASLADLDHIIVLAWANVVIALKVIIIIVTTHFNYPILPSG